MACGRQKEINVKKLFSFLALLAVLGCHKPGPTTPTPSAAASIRVQTMEVSAQSSPAIQEIVGTVESRARATLAAKLSATIDQFPVGLGQAVKKGDLLVKLDAKEVRARLDRATASRLQAETDLRRFTALRDQQALTPAEFDAAEARFRVADASLREAETLLADTEIQAPFDGVVVRKFAEIGDLAAPGKPLLDLEDPATLRFVADVPDTLLTNLHRGMDLEIRAGSSVKGKLRDLSPSANPLSRTARIEVDLPGSELRSGSFGRLQVPAGSRTRVLAPLSSLVRRGQIEAVFVVQDGKAVLRIVKSGEVHNEWVEILSGLRPGERLITENVEHLLDGEAVTLE